MDRNNLSAATITRGLATKLVGQNVFHYPSLGSTMEMARGEVRRGAPEGTIIIADEQTAGQGRLGRVWRSPKGSVALSVILYPDVAFLPSLIMVAALAVVCGIEKVTGLKPQIKWPNDILLAGKKVCGILVENEVRGNVVDYSIVGVGVNINRVSADLSEGLLPATSLSAELGRGVPRLDFVRQLLVELDRLYLSVLGGASVCGEWRDKLVTLGKQVTATWGETKYEGVAESVAEDGSLLLRGADGSLIRIVAGDVSLRE